jgi:hypothetical protein
MCARATGTPTANVTHEDGLSVPLKTSTSIKTEDKRSGTEVTSVATTSYTILQMLIGPQEVLLSGSDLTEALIAEYTRIGEKQ